MRSVRSRRPTVDRRALTPVVGVLLLVAITVVLVGVLSATLVAGVGTTDLSPPATASMDCSADAEADRLTLTHRGGETLTPATLRVRVSVNGVPLARQPPVPFFASEGFESGPTGPFNSAWSRRWTAGTSASLALAGTNPRLDAGDVVRVRLWHDASLVADCPATA
ncbi:type IV pilin [Halomarina oriensis]|uniref:Type IV pilin n=1 Tax=Halomarina oriensis TaxID=671145 RepID=A0A6B0GIR3_9EURY|nr:type IV pilin [Halomarina oriensis]